MTFDIPQSAILPFEPHGIPNIMASSDIVDTILNGLFDGLGDYIIGRSATEYTVEDFVALFKLGIDQSRIKFLVKDMDYFNGAEYDRDKPRSHCGVTLATRITFRYTIDKTYERDWFVEPRSKSIW